MPHPTLHLRTDRSLARTSASSTRYLLATVQAPPAPPRAERPPVNVALVLDRSGSMGGDDKLPLARRAVEQALRDLAPADHFSLVVFDNAIDVLSPVARATAEARRSALAALSEIEPRGGTNLHEGWTRGCTEIVRHAEGGAVTRVLLLTDGQANDGITERHALARIAAEWRARGVVTSTFGVGADFDERLLRDLAHEGGGNFYFIEGASQIAPMLTGELGEALEVVVRRAALEVVLPAGADAEPLNRFRHARALGDNELRVELGDLVSGQEVRAVVKVRLPAGEIGSEVRLQVNLVGETEAGSIAVTHTAGWTYAGHDDNDAQARDREVDREVAGLYAARARAEAAEANRDGDFRRARRVLERTAERIRGYAGRDPELTRLWRELIAEVPRFSETAMDAMALKSAVFVAENSAKGRGGDGRARRR